MYYLSLTHLWLDGRTVYDQIAKRACARYPGSVYYRDPIPSVSRVLSTTSTVVWTGGREGRFHDSVTVS